MAADDFLGACYRKAMTPKKLWTLLFLQVTSLAAKFAAKFSGLVCWDIERKKNFSKISAQNSCDSAQQNWRNFREKLYDEVLQGDAGGG